MWMPGRAGRRSAGDFQRGGSDSSIQSILNKPSRFRRDILSIPSTKKLKLKNN